MAQLAKLYTLPLVYSTFLDIEDGGESTSVVQINGSPLDFKVWKVQRGFIWKKMGPKSPHYEEKRILKSPYLENRSQLSTSCQARWGILNFFYFPSSQIWLNPLVHNRQPSTTNYVTNLKGEGFFFFKGKKKKSWLICDSERLNFGIILVFLII